MRSAIYSVRVRRINLQRDGAWNRETGHLLLNLPHPWITPQSPAIVLWGAGRNTLAIPLATVDLRYLNRLFRPCRIVVVSICKRSYKRTRYNSIVVKTPPLD